MSIGVFSINGKIAWRILLIHLNALNVFSVQAKILLAYLETTLYK
jgi:hypothetical protein